MSGAKKRHRRLQLVEPAVVSRDMQMNARLIAGPRGLGDVGDNPAVEAFRNAGEYGA